MLDQTTHLINNPNHISQRLSDLAQGSGRLSKSLQDFGIPEVESWDFPLKDGYARETILYSGIAYSINLRKKRQSQVLYLAALDYRQVQDPVLPQSSDNIITLAYLDRAQTQLFTLTVKPAIPLRSSQNTFQEWVERTPLTFEDPEYDPYLSIQHGVLLSLAHVFGNKSPQPELVRSGSPGAQIQMLRVLLG